MAVKHEGHHVSAVSSLASKRWRQLDATANFNNRHGINGLTWQGQLGPRSCRKNTAWVPMHAEISKTMLRVLFGLVLAQDVSRLCCQIV